MDKNAHPGKSRILRKRIFLSFLIIFSFLSSGFNLSDTNKIRREIRKKIDAELEKIIEKTPDAKARRKWRETRDRAVKAISDAAIQDASHLAPEEISDAREYLGRAKAYSAGKEYAKATYLGKQALKMAEMAENKAVELLKQKEDKVEDALKKCSEKLQALEKATPPANDAATLEIARLKLKKGYVQNLLRIGKFDEALNATTTLERDIKDTASRLPSSGKKVEEEHWL